MKTLKLFLLQLIVFVVATHSGLAETTSYSGGTNLTTATGSQGTLTVTTPLVISTPGTYYLTQNVLTSGVGTNGVNINASNVTLDLNGHTISTVTPGAAVNTAETGLGVDVGSYSNVTVRNGTIIGFLHAFFSSNASTSYGHRAENLRVSQCQSVGIYMEGADCIVRNCVVNKTSGSTVSGYGTAYYGILLGGPNISVIDCDVSEVPGNGSSNNYGICFYGSTTLYGIALKNRISQVATGIAFLNSATGQYRETLVGAGVTNATNGGVNAGENY